MDGLVNGQQPRIVCLEWKGKVLASFKVKICRNFTQGGPEAISIENSVGIHRCMRFSW